MTFDGQKQIVSIARALLKNSEILILDEATSSLDSENEKIVFEKIIELYKNKTIIFISHRLSTIKNVDEIIFINDGKIVEQGTHNELIKNKGYYYRLYQDQLNVSIDS